MELLHQFIIMQSRIKKACKNGELIWETKTLLTHYGDYLAFLYL